MRAKLSPETHRLAAELVRAGVPLERAAQGAGVSRSTLYRWLERGESGAKRDRPYAEFRSEVTQARAEAQAAIVMRIRKAAMSGGSWRAGVWLLDHAYKPWTAEEVGEVPPQDGDVVELRDELAKRRAKRKRT